MADFRGKPLPNLKISVDNTASSDENESEGEIQEELEEPVVEIEDNEVSEPPQKRVYENKSGTFVTGIDITSKEAAEKRQKRAERFRIQQEEIPQSAVDVDGLYKSLGLSPSDFDDAEKGLRQEAVHLRGTDDMSTKDVFEYFSEFPPSAIEWISDTSCNVVWLDKETAIRAMLKLSSSYDDVMAAEAKRIQAEKERKNQHKQKKSEDQEMKDAEKKDNDADTGGDGDKAGDGDKKADDAGDKKKDEERPAPEKMDVDEDDDNLDLTADADEVKAAKRSQGRRDEDTGELSRERQRTKRKKEQTVPWPAGQWRLATSCQKARYLFMRFATRDDKKEPGAEKRSQYYRRYGNPNYGGMRGLISASR
ncbi:hypothetical protein BaRGS_00034324 [Batillaria attramentaria]|uniref:Nuclear cap-binding protein subunit 3 n=1 Tax=Batillaria attramentaria TaxID=370345 RepID=A0ABD0JHY7_9CAEN